MRQSDHVLQSHLARRNLERHWRRLDGRLPGMLALRDALLAGHAPAECDVREGFKDLVLLVSQELLVRRLERGEAL